MSLLFQEFRIKELTIRNRIVMPPMCQYVAGDDGKVTDWHLVHYGARAVGGVGLVIVEATAVEPRGRLSGGDLGLWEDGQVPGMNRLATFVKSQGAAVGVQLAHGGRKGFSESLIAPSPLRFSEQYAKPEEMSKADIQEVLGSFASGARRAREAGFDIVEIHGAHGYLINEFLSPLTNRRGDEYGGSLENRMRFLVEVVSAVQSEWPVDKPLFVRLSAIDYHPDGIVIEDTVKIAATLRELGVDVVDVSSGGAVPVVPQVGPGYQIPLAEAVKGAGVPTIVVGLITEPEQAEEVLFNGRADLVALGRELLRNPYWPLQAAKRLREEIEWPKPYERSKV